VNGNVHTPVTETLVDVPIDAGIQRLTRWYSVLNAAIQATLSDAHAGVRSEALTALRRQSRTRSSEGSVDSS
jgi:hypothetical protein